MTTTLMVYGTIPANDEEAQERVRSLIEANVPDPVEQAEFLDALGLS
jgi:hypothetical protein